MGASLVRSKSDRLAPNYVAAWLASNGGRPRRPFNGFYATTSHEKLNRLCLISALMRRRSS